MNNTKEPYFVANIKRTLVDGPNGIVLIAPSSDSTGKVIATTQLQQSTFLLGYVVDYPSTAADINCLVETECSTTQSGIVWVFD